MKDKPYIPHGMKIPPVESFEVTDFTPDFKLLQARLAEKGLKDNWIRNFAYNHDIRYVGTRTNKFKRSFLGFFIGIGFAVTATLYKEFYGYEIHHDEYPLLREVARMKAEGIDPYQHHDDHAAHH